MLSTALSSADAGPVSKVDSFFEQEKSSCTGVTTKAKTAEQNKGAFGYLSSIKEDCGELCDTTRSGKPGIYFDQISAEVNCDKLIGNPHWDRPHPKG